MRGGDLLAVALPESTIERDWTRAAECFRGVADLNGISLLIGDSTKTGQEVLLVRPGRSSAEAVNLAPRKRGIFLLCTIRIYGNAVFCVACHTAMPYCWGMQTILSTSIFLAQAKRAGVSSAEMDEIVATIAADPEAGDIMVGTGGARKLRHRKDGQGKSGGFRTIHYFGGGDIPVFLLAIYSKGDKANLSKAERNELARILPLLADAYRQSQQKGH